jgi:hypothetical protein
VTYYNLSDVTSWTSAVADARDATRTMAVLYGAGDEAANVDIRDNQLEGVTEEKLPALGDHMLVDRTARSIDGVATVFERQGGDYVRVSTNVKKENGDRAVGTKLAADHPAQAMLAKGQAYYGPADLFGRKFMTGYFPVKNASGSNVGILFIGIPMELYYSSLQQLLMLVVGAGARLADRCRACLLRYPRLGKAVGNVDGCYSHDLRRQSRGDDTVRPEAERVRRDRPGPGAFPRQCACPRGTRDRGRGAT